MQSTEIGFFKRFIIHVFEHRTVLHYKSMLWKYIFNGKVQNIYCPYLYGASDLQRTFNVIKPDNVVAFVIHNPNDLMCALKT
jgi:hypothetical protein